MLAYIPYMDPMGIIYYIIYSNDFYIFAIPGPSGPSGLRTCAWPKSLRWPNAWPPPRTWTICVPWS